MFTMSWSFILTLRTIGALCYFGGWVTGYSGGSNLGLLILFFSYLFSILKQEALAMQAHPDVVPEDNNESDES